MPKSSVFSGSECPDTPRGLRSTTQSHSSCSHQLCQALTDLTAQPKNPFQRSCQAPLAAGELWQLRMNRMKLVVCEVQAAAVPRIDLVLLCSKEQRQIRTPGSSVCTDRDPRGLSEGWQNKEWPKVKVVCIESHGMGSGFLLTGFTFLPHSQSSSAPAFTSDCPKGPGQVSPGYQADSCQALLQSCPGFTEAFLSASNSS